MNFTTAAFNKHSVKVRWDKRQSESSGGFTVKDLQWYAVVEDAAEEVKTLQQQHCRHLSNTVMSKSLTVFIARQGK